MNPKYLASIYLNTGRADTHCNELHESKAAPRREVKHTHPLRENLEYNDLFLLL